MQPLPISTYSIQIAVQKQIIKSYFTHSTSWDKENKYLVAPLSPYANFFPQVMVIDFKWANEDKLFLLPEVTVRKHLYLNEIIAHCEICFTSLEPEWTEPVTIEHTFRLICKYWFDIDDDSQARIELLDIGRKLLADFNESIFAFYRLKNIDHDDFDLDGQSLRKRFRQSLFRIQPPLTLSIYDAWDELKYCLQRVRYSIANMYLYRPYLDNPIWHGYRGQRSVLFPSYATLYDERYYMYCEFAYQSLYHFWDRVGDVLAAATASTLKPQSIDFSRVIDDILKKPSFNQNLHFKWLDDFKSTEYKVLNEDRKQTVHYETITLRMSRAHTEAFSNKADIEQRQNWIEERVDYFIDHYHKCIEGLKQFTLFIETM